MFIVTCKVACEIAVI